MLHEPICPPDVPCRFGFWNIPDQLVIVFYASMAVALVIMLWGIVRRIQLWRRGQPEFGLDRPLQRIIRVLKYAVAQVKIMWQRYPGVFHFALFWGMVLLFIGTVLATIDSDVFELFFQAKLLQGDFYVFYKVVLDLAGLGFLVGLGMALYRRYIVRPPRLNIDWRFNFTLPLLGLIIITGFLIGALRLAVADPPWGPAQVVAYPISRLLQGAPTQGLLVAHRMMWITHYLIVGVFFATLPYTNLFHIFSSPANIFVAPFRKKGALWPINDLENADQLGAARLTDFAWPRLANFDACTECGRCQDVCPAYAAVEPLNPKYVILNLRDYMTEQQAQLRKLPARKKVATSGDGSQAAEAEKAGSNGMPKGNGHAGADGAKPRRMVGDIITPEVLWDCTTCYNCVHECPVLIDHVDAIIDMRRQLALMEGDLPASLGTTLTNIERSGNPWKQPKRKRAAWTQALDFEVPVMANVGEADVLWWVGCAGSYDPRNQKVTRALATILHEAGVNFAILGEEETCNGDQARRAGNEYLFQQLATQNIETMNQYKFKTIITQCPHCFNVLLNEYPQLGGNYQVMHHSQFVEKLLESGEIRVRRTAGGHESLTYHDPCYLGRYNDIYDAPRELARAGGRTLVEMARSKQDSMCCGGGGARVWMEDEGEVRINRNRVAQILETGQEEVAVACPFCMIMLEDARGALDADQLRIRDIAEIVAENLVITRKAPPAEPGADAP